MVSVRLARDTPPTQDDKLRAFLLVLRRALILIVRHIEDQYDLPHWTKEPRP